MSIQRDYRYFGGQPFEQVEITREFPAVDSTMFSESAVAFQQLLRDASTVLKHLAEDKNFANEVMSAAQHSNPKKVEELIKSTGIDSKVDTTFNPDGITFKFEANVHGTDCCKLSMTLRW
ncbi:hypothetical protein JOC85_002078 [Bacillus mesophilus]|uniref:Uncharacterized protein n=1 Tax=Bacillus mesophilus TaxID=1808955 RepID=A0A6M0Q4L8_9BACI|nr:hypothetical protein [Bacillus mesophilus]MBM7661306.1 hypothetical protein [Bacillus mesophilus]NEY71173.1 hypothetical protein [Bacillus mesophilus]